MVRSDTNSISIGNLSKRLAHKGSPYAPCDQIAISSDFQRGSEENGVWNNQQKVNYIYSILNCFPTGILTFVKENNIDESSYQETWKTLDGGNRYRALRDFIGDKIKITLSANDTKHEYLYSELDADTRAHFNTTTIPCQWMIIENDDPIQTVADMFICLNTSSTKLKPGELYKAASWKHSVFEIELAKSIIGKWWITSLSDDNTFKDFEKYVEEIKNLWKTIFKSLSETKRCDTISKIMSLIMSSMYGFEYYDADFSKIKLRFTNINSVKNIELHVTQLFKNMLMLFDIISDIPNNYSWGLVCGMPAKAKIAPIWKHICDKKMNIEDKCKFTKFYKHICINKDELVKFEMKATETGDNHATTSKISNIINYIFEQAKLLD